MTVEVRYMAQVRRAAGVGSEQVELGEPCSVPEFIARRARARGEELSRLLLAADGALRPTILLFVGEEQVERGADRPVRDGDLITVLAPMAGG